MSRLFFILFSFFYRVIVQKHLSLLEWSSGAKKYCVINFSNFTILLIVCKTEIRYSESTLNNMKLERYA